MDRDISQLANHMARRNDASYLARFARMRYTFIHASSIHFDSTSDCGGSSCVETVMAEPFTLAWGVNVVPSTVVSAPLINEACLLPLLSRCNEGRVRGTWGTPLRFIYRA
jgi:hypothetical protein